MQALPDALSPTTHDLDARISFLTYMSDFLNQFTRSSEALNMHQVAYFLSMAAIESADFLAKLESLQVVEAQAA